MKLAVEPTALLLLEEEEEPELVVPVLAPEDWGSEEETALEAELPVVPELDPEYELGSEPVLELVFRPVLDPLL